MNNKPLLRLIGKPLIMGMSIGPRYYAPDGWDYYRVTFGHESDSGVAHLDHCPSCGVAKEELHEWGCVLEVCPLCMRPFISCRCEWPELHK